MRAFFFLVFFDMGYEPSGVAFRFHSGGDDEPAQVSSQPAPTQRNSMSAPQALMPRSIGTFRSAARLQP